MPPMKAASTAVRVLEPETSTSAGSDTVTVVLIVTATHVLMLQTSDGGEVRDDVADALVLLVARLLVPGGHACEAGRAAEVGLDAVFALFASREEVLEKGDGLVSTVARRVPLEAARGGQHSQLADADLAGVRGRHGAGHDLVGRAGGGDDELGGDRVVTWERRYIVSAQAVKGKHNIHEFPRTAAVGRVAGFDLEAVEKKGLVGRRFVQVRDELQRYPIDFDNVSTSRGIT